MPPKGSAGIHHRGVPQLQRIDRDEGERRQHDDALVANSRKVICGLQDGGDVPAAVFPYRVTDSAEEPILVLRLEFREIRCAEQHSGVRCGHGRGLRTMVSRGRPSPPSTPGKVETTSVATSSPYSCVMPRSVSSSV